MNQFLLAGANSDLFGRRLFLLFGNVCAVLGMLISATAHTHQQFIGKKLSKTAPIGLRYYEADLIVAGLAIAGFGGGACQMAMCSIPE